MTPWIVVLLRGVAPSTWASCKRVLDAVAEVAPIPVTLLVVPRLHGEPHSALFDAQLSRRLDRGDELALHGYMHEEDGPSRGTFDQLRRSYTGAEAEFRSLRCDDALQRLHAGMRWFAASGWPLAGFVAPHAVIGPGAWAALRLTPFTYTLTQDALCLLRSDDQLPSHTVLHDCRSAWSRALTLAWNEWPGRLGQDAAPLLRLELSPHDADHPKVRQAWQRCLHRHLQYRHSHTAAGVAQWWERQPQRLAERDAAARETSSLHA